MENIHPLQAEDIPDVAQLFQKIFRHTDTPAPASLISYFRQIYIENPWRDEAFPSLVYKNEGTVWGFLGAIPFHMTLNGAPIRAVIGGNYMVDPSLSNPLAGMKILKRLLSGPQDVTYSDTSTAHAKKIWEGLGSTSVPLYSLQWLRVLRPVEFAVHLGTRRSALRVLPLFSKLLSYPIDLILTTIPKSPFRCNAGTFREAELSADGLLEAVRIFSSEHAIAPVYTDRSLKWLLQKAESKKEHGPLRKIAFFNKHDVLQGWVLYYPNAGKLGHVLQLGADRQTIKAVLTHLFADARSHGSLALAGRMEPKYIGELSAQNCMFTHRDSSLVVHSRNAEILNAFHRGDAFFTRLEGEWWTRLQGDRFTNEE